MPAHKQPFRIERLHGDPIDVATIAEANAYIAAAHLTIPQFASYVGYGESTMTHWLAGRYQTMGGNQGKVSKHVRHFIETNPINPTPEQAGRFYDTENVATMRQWFTHCLGEQKGRGRMACIYSGPGGQKTFIAEQLIAELNRLHIAAEPKARPRAFRVYCSQDIRPAQLVEKMLEAAGIARGARMQANLASLRFHLRTARTLFIFDEAQHLSIPCLEIVRELNDLRPYFGVILLGSHKLRMVFENRAAEMEQWNSRLTASVELPGISEATALYIIQQELMGIAKLSQGKLDLLLRTSMTDDIYSREKGTYRSARKLFNSIEQIRDQSMASIQTAQSAGGVQ